LAKSEVKAFVIVEDEGNEDDEVFVKEEAAAAMAVEAELMAVEAELTAAAADIERAAEAALVEADAAVRAAVANIKRKNIM